MKRNSITKKIISLVLAVLMISSSFVCAPIEVSAADKVKTYGIQFPRKEELAGADKAWEAGFGTITGTLVNGKKFDVNVSFNGLHAVGSYNTLSFCIAPGVDISQDATLNQIAPSTTPDSDCNTLAEKAVASATDIQITGPQMKYLLSCILGYGYEHDNSTIYSWQNLITEKDGKYYSSGSADAKRFSEAYATQLLIWELVVGERTSTFDLATIPPGYISSTTRALRPENPLYSSIMENYRRIEQDVKNAAVYSDSHIESKTYTLKTNDALKRMEITIPDANGLYQNLNSIPGINGASISHENNELKISIPYRYAKEGTYKIEFKKKVKVVEDINFYISTATQSMISANGSIKEIEKDGTLTLIIPHHHEWVPHLVIPTCTTEGYTCMMCKCGQIYTKDQKDHLNHDYTDSAWVVGYKATCTEAGEEVQICKRCNAVINTRPIEATGHNNVWIIEAEPTADHKGQMVAHCTKCGIRTETKSYEAHDHRLGYTAVVRDATCTTDGLTGKFCKDCGVCYETKEISAGHSEELIWVTTVRPTCTEKGENSGYCAYCGDIVATEPVEAEGHSAGIWMTSIAPYCGLTGEDICICDKCGETIDSRETEALSHDEGVWKTTKDPTCELDGERAKACTRCGHTIETEAIEKLGHDEGVWKIDIEATADLDGSMGRYCTRCSMVLETKAFTLHTHEEGYKVTLLQPTCTRDGEKGTACKICNAVYNSETTPALSHDYSEFYTENNGTHSKSCSRCHYVYTENCDYEVIEAVEANCVKAGYKTSKCTVCNHTYSDAFVAPYGHHLGKWESEGKSTHMRYCIDCGVMEISKHVWGEYFSNNDGNLIEEGSKTRSCIYCGETQTIGEPAHIIESACKATMDLLDFLLELFAFLKVFFAELEIFIESVKS